MVGSAKYRHKKEIEMEEIWKELEIDGMEYKVSNLGNITGVASNKLLKTRLNSDGYETVTVGKYDKRTSKRVHRLVAMLFVENPNNEAEVNHIDFNRTNNKSDNLEWISHVDNIQHTINAGRHASQIYDYKGENNPNYNNNTLKLKYQNNPELTLTLARKGVQNGRCKQIEMYDKNGALVNTFDYIGECAEFLKEKKSIKAQIGSIRDRITKSIKTDKCYMNYTFKFKEVI